MAVTMQQVLAVLAPDEIDYAVAARLGSDALPHLNQLISGSDVGLAAKATYLAGLIPHATSASAVERAAHSQEVVVRVAAAAAARNLPELAASRILVLLLADQDAGVRRNALKSVPLTKATPELRRQVERLSTTEIDPGLRQMLRDKFSRLQP
jgi:hypothetical protein